MCPRFQKRPRAAERRTISAAKRPNCVWHRSCGGVRVDQLRMADAASPAFLTIDNRAPGAIRELIVEAEGCLKAGFLTGGTVCAQRAIQTLLQHESAEGASY